MRKVVLYSLIILAFAACRNHDFDFEEKYVPPLNEVEQQLADMFSAKYGTPSKSVTWMTAKEDTAYVDMSSLDRNVHYTVRFYTSNPVIDNRNCYLLAEYPAVRGGEAEAYVMPFDRPLGLKYIYVSAIEPNGTGYTYKMNAEDADQHDVYLAKILPNPIPSRQAMRYTIGFEGLTAEGIDFDYNDVVLEVEYVRGHSDARVILKAAGNSCNTKVIYRHILSKKKHYDDVLFEETHAAIGYPAIYNFATKKNIYYILNTGINDSKRTAETVLELNEDEGKSICEIAPNFISFFKIDDKEKGDGESYFLPDYKGCTHPEALLLAVPDWNWSPEGMAVHVQHMQFRNWVKEPEKYPLWYTDVWDEVNER